MGYLEVDASEVNFLAKLFAKATGKFGSIKREALSDAGDKFVGHMRDTMEPVKWKGELEQSVSVISVDEQKVVIGPDARHTKYVRHGTGPHTPPFSKIYHWTVTKLGGNQRDAYKIWWGIRERGTSQFAARTFGTSGDFPFPELTLEKPEAQETLQDTADEIGEKLIAEFT